MKLNKLEAIGDKTVLFGRGSTFDIFKRVERGLWQENIVSGLPRFLEFANLLFLKLLEERHKDPLWASLKAEPNKIPYLNGFLIPKLHARYDAQDIFAETRITKESLVKKIVAILDNCLLASFDSDILGDAYEYFLKDNVSSKQSLGQFFYAPPYRQSYGRPGITDERRHSLRPLLRHGRDFGGGVQCHQGVRPLERAKHVFWQGRFRFDTRCQDERHLALGRP